MTKLVVAIDLDSTPDRVVGFAGGLADRLGLRLVVAHVVRSSLALPVGHGPEPVGADSAADRPHIQRAVARRIQERLARISEDARAHDADPRVPVGDPADSLLSISCEHETQLLVLGSRGRGSLQAAALGSVSRKVIARAGCPVVVVPPGAPVEAPTGTREEPIVCGYDGSEEATIALRAVIPIAERLRQRIVIATSLEAPVAATAPAVGLGPPAFDSPSLKEARERRGEEIRRRAFRELPDGLDVATAEAPGPPIAGLRSLALDLGAALVAVGSRGHGALASLLIGSTSSSLAADSPCPVLVCTGDARIPRIPSAEPFGGDAA